MRPRPKWQDRSASQLGAAFGQLCHPVSILQFRRLVGSIFGRLVRLLSVVRLLGIDECQRHRGQRAVVREFDGQLGGLVPV